MVERAGLIEAFAHPQVGSAHLVGRQADAAVAAVVQLLQRLSVAAEVVPEVGAIVLDPVIVSAGAASITDVRLRLDLVTPEERLPVRRLADH
jgi:hypothetical protein